MLCTTGELTHPILGFHDVTFGYSKDKILYKDLDFGIDLGSRIALVCVCVCVRAQSSVM